MKDKITKIKNYTSTAKNTPYQAANGKQKATKIGLTTLRTTLFLAKWALYITLGITAIMFVLMLSIITSSINESAREAERKSFAREIAKNIRVPRY